MSVRLDVIHPGESSLISSLMLKKLNAWVHLWFGLVSGIIVIILGITGCILVFEEELKYALYPWTKAERPAGADYLPPSALRKAAEEALPGFKLGTVWYKGDDKAAFFSVRDSDSLIYINPYTADITGIVDHEDFFHFIDEGHRNLWLPHDVGHQLVGWGTFVFFILLITGLVLWWPKKWNKRGIEQGFKIKWKAKFKRVNYDLHNVLGFYSLLIAVVLAYTGLMMSFRWFNKSVFWLAGGEVKERSFSFSDTTKATSSYVLADQVDRAWQMGLTQIGQYNKRAIISGIPESIKDPLYICVDMYNGGWREVYLDQHTLEELPQTQAKMKEEPVAVWLRRMNYGLHVGEVGGLPTKIIYFLASLICASLPVTGFLVWLGKKKKIKKQHLQKTGKALIAVQPLN